jgi:hypothetical protein
MIKECVIVQLHNPAESADGLAMWSAKLPGWDCEVRIVHKNDQTILAMAQKAATAYLTKFNIEATASEDVVRLGDGKFAVILKY